MVTYLDSRGPWEPAQHTLCLYPGPCSPGILPPCFEKKQSRTETCPKRALSSSPPGRDHRGTRPFSSFPKADKMPKDEGLENIISKHHAALHITSIALDQHFMSDFKVCENKIQKHLLCLGHESRIGRLPFLFEWTEESFGLTVSQLSQVPLLQQPHQSHRGISISA